MKLISAKIELLISTPGGGFDEWVPFSVDPTGIHPTLLYNRFEQEVCDVAEAIQRAVRPFFDDDVLELTADAEVEGGSTGC